MKLRCVLLLLVTVQQLAPGSFQGEEGLRLPILAVSEDGGEQLAVFESQKDDSLLTPEDEEPARRVRGRNVKRRRRMRKRLRTTTEPPLEEQNEQLNAAEQQNPIGQQILPEQQAEKQAAVIPSPAESGRVALEAQQIQDVAHDQVISVEEGTAQPPFEETTRRRPGKRRRRPHRKYQHDETTDNSGDSVADSPKPQRRRRKGGRRRARPTVQPTEPNKIELVIETTMMPPDVAEITTPAYIPEIITQLPFTESPDQTLTVLKDDNTPLYRIYDSRHNLVSQPSVNIVPDGNEQFPQPSRISSSANYQEKSRVPQHPTNKETSIISEPTTYTEMHFPSKPSVSNVPREHQLVPEPSGIPVTQKYSEILQFPEPGKYSEPHFPPRLVELRHNVDSFSQPQQPSITVFSGQGQNPPISKVPEHQKEPEISQTQTSKHSRVQMDPARYTKAARPKPYSAKPAYNVIKPVQELIQESEHEPSEHHEEGADKESNEVPSQPPTEIISSEPTFDRKVLFAKSRKLPQTSAGIRKKLVPRQRGNPTNNEIPQKMVPEGYTAAPQTVEPSKLIEKLKAHAKSYRTTTVMIPHTIITTEEPNYPKFESKKEKNSATENFIKTTTESMRFNKVVELHRSRGKVEITTTQAPQLEDFPTTMLDDETDTTETGKIIEDNVPEAQDIQSNSNPNEFDLNKLNDSIVELLKTDSGNMKLTEILESRNMTLPQLLEHRERGSRHFHLVDIFSKRKAIIGENTTDSMNADKAEVGTPVYLDRQTIPFPSQDVLGSFPAFITDKVQNGGQTKDGINETTTKKSVHLENRVPRVFDSMPDFKKASEQPPWKIPNPKLRPVSIRGDIEEIKISQYPHETPKSENDIDHAFLLEDKADLLRPNRGVTSLEAESRSQETGLGRFKRISVTVKSAIIISTAILILAIFGFLSVLISCRLKQKKARLRVKQDILCEHLKTEDFMNSQQSLSPVLTKQTGRAPPVFTQNSMPPNAANNRQYYLWRTLRKTFQYD